MTSSTDLAALLCSRLCHDLLSPVGALSNGLELLADEKDPEMRRRCFELLEQSAKISTDKLKFFRLAYGAAGGFGDVVPTEEPKDLVSALVAASCASATMSPSGLSPDLLGMRDSVAVIVPAGRLAIGAASLS